MIDRGDLIKPPLYSYYIGHKFDRNFLNWAPEKKIDRSNSFFTFCSGRTQGGPCTDTIGSFRVGDLVAGDITAVEHGGAFIALVCGNFSGEGSGPIPSITGRKYEDLNGDGDRDSGEPWLTGWTIKLLYKGSFVTSTTTDAQGRYEFELDVETHKSIGPGRYTVEEVQKAGWRASEAPGSIVVPVGVGGEVFAGNDFGNYRPATIRGHKFDDPDVDGIWDVSDPGLGGWTIGLSGDASATDVTAADGSYSFTVAPGTYTLAETLKPGWRRTAPLAPATHSFTVQSGQVVENADFGNVCLGTVEVKPVDVSTGLPVTGMEIHIDEVSVPDLIDNDPALPRMTTGTPTFEDLLPGTYEITAFLPDGVFTTDPGLTSVDGRLAVVKEVVVRPCETSEVPIELFTESTPGKVTGGNLIVPLERDVATGGFVFMARSPDGARGSLQYNDHDTGLNLHTSDIQAIRIEDNVAFVGGTVEYEGTRQTFQLRLVDAGEPGDSDRFELLVANGYGAGFGVTLGGGNIQVHDQR